MAVLGGAGLFLISEEPLYGAEGFLFTQSREREREREGQYRQEEDSMCRGTSLIRTRNPPGSYGGDMSRALRWS